MLFWTKKIVWLEKDSEFSLRTGFDQMRSACYDYNVFKAFFLVSISLVICYFDVLFLEILMCLWLDIDEVCVL